MIWLGTAVNELFITGEANQHGFYYQILPDISFATTGTVSITRYPGQADSTEAILEVNYDKLRFPLYESAHFPISYSASAVSGGSVPTVTIDTSVTPNVLAITDMASIAAGDYDYEISANH